MPIAAAMMPMKSQIESSMKLDIAGNADLTSLLITSAIASGVPMGFFPPAPVPIPLIPAGFAACKNALKSAFSLDIAGSPDLVAQLMAAGIALLAPMAPPAGMSILQSQLKSAFSLDIAGNPNLCAQLIALGVVNFYMAGGVI